MDKSNFDLSNIKGIGPQRVTEFHKFGIQDLHDLVRYTPRTYYDFTNPTKIKDLKAQENFCVLARVRYSPTRTKVSTGVVFSTYATDDTGIIHIVIFNSSYSANKLRSGEPYFFYGKVVISKMGNGLEMINPVIDNYLGKNELFMRPVYSQSAVLRSGAIERIMKNALQSYRQCNILDSIPDDVRQKYKLCHEQYALESIHFPKSENDIEIAKRRLVFEELFVFQTAVALMRRKNRGETDAIIKENHCQEFIDTLPFTLTGAQKKAIDDCVADVARNIPMNRLIQGDVGSGKTVVAAAVIYSAVKNGFQCALMAPTELLARQHYNTLKSMMPEDITVALLTGSTTIKSKKEIKEDLENGKINIIVGTHALITPDVKFARLGLIVTDEQHRFGVKQRGTLNEKGKAPHVLVMSATPIPRTLSLILYGDLDITIIDELPAGRQKIKTYAVDSSYRKRVYGFIKKYLCDGLQAYIVCPAVEQNENGLIAAQDYAEKLRSGEFASFNVGLLHGKMKAIEKKRAMEIFAAGETQLLISTTVIEVGIDVPNAVVMVIENAERFGLSQLHQLRGRVGRGPEKSHCILISDAKGETAEKRMKILCGTNDGFEIAEQDLKMRGPGDFFGSRQSGLPNLRMASHLDNMVLVEQTRKAARDVLEDDPELKKEKNAGLLAAVERLTEKLGNLVMN